MFKRNDSAAGEPTGDIKTIEVAAELADGKYWQVTLYVRDHGAENEAVRFAEAMAAGLSGGGFPAKVTLVREQREVRA